MATEIEKKFTVDQTIVKILHNGLRIQQGYLPSPDKTVVRIRIAHENAWLTIKGANRGAVRSEFEYEIPPSDAQQILEELCVRPFITKTRYSLTHAGNNWEIDVFEGENEGLIIAEIELESESQPFDKPPWVHAEVTGDPRYFNSNLIKHPYKSWNKGR